MHNIVISGCSYTECDSMNILDSNEKLSWPSFLNAIKPDGITIESYGKSAMGNDYISRSIIYQCQQLLNKGKSSDNIFVICCWSGLQRRSVLYNDDTAIMHSADDIIKSQKQKQKQHFESMKSFDLSRISTDRKHHNNKIQLSNQHKELGWWVNFNQEFLSFLPTEQIYISSIEDILRTQYYLESKNIKYKFFSAGDLFSSEHHMDYQFNIIKKYFKNKDETIFDIFPNLKYLYKEMNWDNWWFYKKYGGMSEWMLGEIGKNSYPQSANTSNKLGNLHDHPLISSYKQFAEKVAINFIKEYLK